jgi:hypothetical protein
MKELWSRFAILLVRLDSEGLKRICERVPANQPVHYYNQVIISVDTLKQSNWVPHPSRSVALDVIACVGSAFFGCFVALLGRRFIRKG